MDVQGYLGFLACMSGNKSNISVPISQSLALSRQITIMALFCSSITYTRFRQRSGSVVERLTRDQGAAGWSLTGVTALCP